MRASRHGLSGASLERREPCLSLPAVQQVAGTAGPREQQELLVRLLETAIRGWEQPDATIALALLGLGPYQGRSYNDRLRVINRALGSRSLSGPESVWSRTYRKLGAKRLSRPSRRGLGCRNHVASDAGAGWWLGIGSK